MLKIGVTGGIGSGKSTVCNYLKNIGVPVFTSDEVAIDLLNKNSTLKEKVKRKFGREIYKLDRTLDRERLATIVFKDPQALESLNQMVHPVVEKTFINWCELHSKRAYIIKEAAILFETGNYKTLDKVITVFAPQEERIKRAMKRDGVTKEMVMKRVRFQLSDEERNKMADYIIINENKAELLPQIMHIHEMLLNETPIKRRVLN